MKALGAIPARHPILVKLGAEEPELRPPKEGPLPSASCSPIPSHTVPYNTSHLASGAHECQLPDKRACRGN